MIMMSKKRGDQNTQEAIRIKAVKARLKGKKAGEVAETFGITTQALRRWIIKYEKGGIKALKNKTRGRALNSKRSLTSEQESYIYQTIIDKYPDQLKFSFGLWSREAIRQLILREFKIDMPLRTITGYLQRWGMTPQKPIKRAYEKDDKKVSKWLKEEYPNIKKRAQKENAEIHWGDETNCQSIPNNFRGFSPKGVTPVLKHSVKKFKVNMISSVSNTGKMRFMFFDGSFNSNVFIEFMKRLIKGANKKVFLIVDNLRVHHSKVIKDWVAKRHNEIELFYLPPYCPDLNPDEYLNNAFKQNANKKKIPKNQSDLEKNTRGYMRSLQKRPDNIKGFFNHERTKYAS